MEYTESYNDTQGNSASTVLIADPYAKTSPSLANRLAEIGFEIVSCTTLTDAMSACVKTRPAYVLTELPFSDGSGIDLIKMISAYLPATKTIVHSWFADIPAAVAAAKAGAADVVPKPTNEEFMISILMYGAGKVPQDCRIQSPSRVRQEHVEQILKFSGSNLSIAARRLLLDRRSLQRMLKRYENAARSGQNCDTREIP